MTNKNRLIALSTAAALSLSLVLPTTAATAATAQDTQSSSAPIPGAQPLPTEPSITSTSSRFSQDLQETENLERVAVTVVAGKVTLDSERAKKAGISDRIISDYSRGLTIGSLNDLSKRTDAEPYASLRGSCKGKNGNGVAIWGPWFQLDSCNTGVIIGLMNSGAGAAVIAGALSSETGAGGIAGTVVAGVLAIGAGAIGVCSSDGNGVVLRVLWTGTPYCTGP
ncbi:hypothetical protein [Mycetocola saprophilus]|uniref:hypothetical protein n=1 Tax=Mycetocola saprophilus TaxID=76636 RepID=UPI003BF1C8F7